ncbi:MAG: methyl-accepting chemotaxis protein [Myxococcota bacterium]
MWTHSIRWKLGAFAAVLLALSFVVAGAAYAFASRLQGDAAVLNTAGRQRMLSQRMARDAFSVVAGIDEAEARASLRSAVETFDQTLQSLMRLQPGTAADAAVLSKLQDVEQRWNQLKAAVLVVAATPRASEELQRAMVNVRPAVEALVQQLDETVAIYESLSRDKVNQLQRMVGWAVLLALLVAMLGWAATGALVIAPVKRLVASAMRLADGDLDQAPVFQGYDEVGDAGRSLRLVIDALNSMITSIQNVSTEMERTSALVRAGSKAVVTNAEQQTNLVDHMITLLRGEVDAAFRRISDDVSRLASAARAGASATQELERAMGELAEGTEALSSSIEQTASAQGELSTSMQSVGESVTALLGQMDVTEAALQRISGSLTEVQVSTGETARLAEAVIDDAHAGLVAVQTTRASNESIRTVTDEGRNAIRSLDRRLQEMEGIMDVIENVARETKILSLNAALIASQAGDQGESFAVVAQRVRGLAERSARSTYDVAELLGGIRADSRRAVEAMTRAGEQVDQGVALSGNAVDALDKIVVSARRSTERVQGIARASVAQAKDSRSAVAAMELARTMCARIALAMEEQSKGGATISGAADRIETIAQQARDATNQQVVAIAHIRKLGEEVGVMVRGVEQVVEGHQRARTELLDTAGMVVALARDTSAQARKTDVTIDEMASQTSALGQRVARFRLRRATPLAG